MPIEETKRLPKRSQNNVEQNRTEPTTIGINSTAPMIEGALTHVTLVALPNGLRAPTNSLVHRTLAEKARQDILRFITDRHQPKSPDQSQTCRNPPLTSRPVEIFLRPIKCRIVCGSLNGTITCWKRQFSTVHKSAKISCEIEQGSFVTMLPRCVKMGKNYFNGTLSRLWWNPQVWPLIWKPLSSPFMWCC